MNPPAPPPLLSMRNIRHSYGETRALNGVDFDLARGEIHALLGEHRAGKSSLVKILAGAERRRDGTIAVDGVNVPRISPETATKLGIGIVYQHTAVIPDLNVVENVFAGCMMESTWKLLDRRAMEEKTRAILERIGVDLNPRSPLFRLPAEQQHLVEFARALAVDPKILVLDEISNKLTPEEMKKVYRVILELKEKGGGIIYISHDMDEVLRLADRVTILKDGYRRETALVKNLDHYRLLRMTYSFSLDQQKIEFADSRFDLLKKYFDPLVQTLPVGVLVLDASRTPRLVNYAAVELLGRAGDAEKADAALDVEAFLAALPAQAAAGLRAAIDGGLPGSWDEVPYGERKLLRIEARPLEDDLDEVAGCVLTVEDVAMDKRIDEYLIRSEKMASVAEVAVGVAHEINNPLFIIQNYVELIKAKAPDPDVQEKVSRIERELDRISKILTSLLSFSRIKPLPGSSVDLRAIVEESALLLNHSVKEKRIRLETRLGETPARVVGDENKLKQVFINLIGNSADAVLDRGLIEIALTEDPKNGYFNVSVRDDGAGIPDDVAEKVFDPFFSTKVSKKNTGLGLSICRHIVEEHQGAIEFSSVPGKGTTFTVALPRSGDSAG